MTCAPGGLLRTQHLLVAVEPAWGLASLFGELALSVAFQPGLHGLVGVASRVGKLIS